MKKKKKYALDKIGFVDFNFPNINLKRLQRTYL